MNLKELKANLENDLVKQIITPNVLLGHLRVISESSRKTSAYVDPRYIPFYYYLGKYLQPKNMIEMGFGLAFFSTCFMRSCKTVENFLAFQEVGEEYYSNNLALKNIKTVYRNSLNYYQGSVNDKIFQDCISKNKWDLILFNEEKDYDKHMLYLDVVWSHLNLDGYIVMDYIQSHENAKRAFHNFCKIENREPIILPTRYGVGIIQK